jgi:hypothetical protein
MPQTLNQLKSRKRKLERELDEVDKCIERIKDFANFRKICVSLLSTTMVTPDELNQYPDWIVKRFAGGIFRLEHANGMYSLYGKTATGILWRHVRRGGRTFWEKVDGQ